MARAVRGAVALCAILFLLACGPAWMVEQVRSEPPARAQGSAAGSQQGPAGQAADETQQAAIQLVIYRANFQQELAISQKDSTVMRDTATDRYYREMTRINQDLLANRVAQIRLVALEWGTVTMSGSQAEATTFETWSTTLADGASAQLRERNVYSLVQVGGAWRIQANEHPDNDLPLPRVGPQV